MSINGATLVYNRTPNGDLRSAVNSSDEMDMLADACGMFGLACFALLFFTFVSYVVLAGCRARDRASAKIGKMGCEETHKDHPTADDMPSLSTLQHSVSHLAVIMDGNRRYGKQKCARSSVDDQEARASAMERLCQEVCFEREMDCEVTAAPLLGLPESGSGRSWLNDRYQYFLSLIRSTALDGHRRGGEKLIDFIKYCIEARIEMLTLYAFSTDNWNRPVHEVDALMTLFFFFFERIRVTARENGIFIRFVSTDPSRLPPRIQTLMRVIECESRLLQPRRITVNVCVSYSGQQEVLRACNRLMAERLRHGRVAEPISKRELDAEMLRSITQDEHEAEDHNVFTSYVPREPQLVLRTSGEQRISNFLLYESAYAELVFTAKTWPEMTAADLYSALRQYSTREKRLGR